MFRNGESDAASFYICYLHLFNSSCHSIRLPSSWMNSPVTWYLLSDQTKIAFLMFLLVCSHLSSHFWRKFLLVVAHWGILVCYFSFALFIWLCFDFPKPIVRMYAIEACLKLNWTNLWTAELQFRWVLKILCSCQEKAYWSKLANLIPKLILSTPFSQKLNLDSRAVIPAETAKRLF